MACIEVPCYRNSTVCKGCLFLFTHLFAHLQTHQIHQVNAFSILSMIPGLRDILKWSITYLVDIHLNFFIMSCFFYNISNVSDSLGNAPVCSDSIERWKATAFKCTQLICLKEFIWMLIVFLIAISWRACYLWRNSALSHCESQSRGNWASWVTLCALRQTSSTICCISVICVDSTQ